MLRKILFALILIASLGITSAFALTARADTLPTWEKVFTVPNHDNFQLIWAVETFKDNLYIAVSDLFDGMRLYRSANGKDWVPANEPGFGFGYESPISWDMTVYEGKMYVSVNDLDFWGTPGRVVRSADGQNWDMVFEAASDPSKAHLPAAFGEFKGMLYVAVQSWVLGVENEIWRSPHGDPGTWEKVLSIEDLNFGAPLVSFKGYAYVSGANVITGQVSLLRSADGVNWESVGTGLVDDPTNTRDGSLAVFNDSLYMSVYNPGGGRVYVTQDGVNWETVTEDGFGEPAFQEIAGLIVYKGDLYVTGTAFVPDVWKGARVYRSHSGKPGTWEPISTESWGASGSERMQQAVFKGELYISDFDWWTGPSDLNKLVVH